MKKCEGEDYCASNSDIDKYIDSHFAYYYLNEQIFNPNDYTENVIEDFVTSTIDRLDVNNPKMTLY